MKIFFLAFCLTLVYCSPTLAQPNDDFSDNDFTLDPLWAGDATVFLVNPSQELQLNASASGTSFLSTAFPLGIGRNNVEWQFYIKLNFSPSASNSARVYLASDNNDLGGELNGYYLQFGEAGSNDAIELFRQSGQTMTSVCRGTNGKIASSFAARIKVTRTADGDWNLYADFAGGTNFSPEASGEDPTNIAFSFLGVLCKYTISNGHNFFFDDFLSEVIGPNMILPALQLVSAISSSELDLLFTKQLDVITAKTPMNYDVQSIGSPERVEVQPDAATVKLFFADKFPKNQQCFITVSGIQDKDGNNMLPITKPFSYMDPISVHRKDIIFTEIFADPSPQIGLPQAEYVELYNRSSNPVDLSNWRFTDGTSTGVLPPENIASQDYIILTSASNISLFSSFGRVLGVSNFPTLNNSSDHLVLRNSSGLSVDSVNYSDSWYRDDDKQVGGWSLELIDINNICGESENWTASEDERGGTPGTQNSVKANKPDLTGPKLLSAIAISPDSVTLRFDEKLNKKLPLLADFSVLPAIGIAGISFGDATMTSIDLLLGEQLQKEVLYTLSVQNVYDCTGNPVQPETRADFSLVEQADSLNVVVNEILFNPRPTGVDFVEIYNNSPKFISLKNWRVANMTDGMPYNGKTITEDDYILHPFCYVVLTENSNIVKSEYPLSIESAMLKIDNLPEFKDDEGSVVLVNERGEIIDYFNYSKVMHSPFIKDEEGVSLERIGFIESTNDPQNWKSGASVVGFATPGYQNSSARPDSTIPDESITVEPEIFVPLSGQPDFTQIKYNFRNSNYVANVKILDVQGREIKALANNEILGSEGFFRWDGDRNNGGKARVGCYIVSFEIFDPAGDVKTFRKRVVVATRF